jgi:hypothetical protein
MPSIYSTMEKPIKHLKTMIVFSSNSKVLIVEILSNRLYPNWIERILCDYFA